MGARRPRSSRDLRRRAYGQNFLASREVAAQLVREANVRPGDHVVEIGAGTGILTAELARAGATVRAIEVDRLLAAKLRKRFAPCREIEIIEGDALRVALPGEPFRVVASVPFNVTTALLHHLLDEPRVPLQRADLVLQWEVARKRSGRPRTSVSASWSPWWRFLLGRRIPRRAFRPQPAVDAGVLVVERRLDPLLPPEAHEAFGVFVQAVLAGSLARELDPRTWAALFDAYER